MTLHAANPTIAPARVRQASYWPSWPLRANCCFLKNIWWVHSGGLCIIATYKVFNSVVKAYKHVNKTECYIHKYPQISTNIHAYLPVVHIYPHLYPQISTNIHKDPQRSAQHLWIINLLVGLRNYMYNSRENHAGSWGKVLAQKLNSRSRSLRLIGRSLSKKAIDPFGFLKKFILLTNGQNNKKIYHLQD